MKQLLFSLLLLLPFFLFAQTKEDYYKKASAFRDKGDHKNALAQVKMALRSDSLNTDYLFLKAEILYDLKEYMEAYETFSKILELEPTDVVTLNQRGLLLHTVSQFDYAIADFDQGLTLNPKDTMKLSLYLNRGSAKISKRNFSGAYDDFMQAYRLDSLNVGVLNNLATVCDEVGKGDQTLGYLYKILAIDSTFVGAYGNIGFKYQQMGDYKKATTFFDKVLSLSPNEPLAYSNRSFNRYKTGDLTGALKDANKAIELYPSNSFAFKNRALIYIAQNKMKNACDDLAQAIELGFTNMYGEEVEQLQEKYCNQ